MRRRLYILVFCLLASISTFPEETRRVRLTFLGDIMAHTVNYRVEDYHAIYDAVAPLLRSDDVTFANLEFTIDPDRPYASYPWFNVHPEYVQAAVNSGVDAFSLANNHSWDGEEAGVLRTLESAARLKAAAGRPIWFSGLRPHTGRPFLPERIEVNGVRLGFLAVTQFTNDHRRHPTVHMVNYLNPLEVETFLAWLRPVVRGYDLFVLSYHGGTEYEPVPEPAKEEFFYRLVQAGVHIVYGHHPHVLQPLDLVRTGSGTRLIIHSAGNFISGMTWRLDPADPAHPRAATGDSLLYLVEAEFPDGQPPRLEVRTVGISNYLNSRMELVVDTMENLNGRKLPGLWSAYYRERHRLLVPLRIPRRVIAP